VGSGAVVVEHESAKSGPRAKSDLTCDVKLNLTQVSSSCGGTAAAVPPPFKPGNPALRGSRPLFTSYYCRLGDLL